MNSNKFGHVVHFTHTDIERRSKRSFEDHPAIADLANHPYVSIKWGTNDLGRIRIVTSSFYSRV